MYQGCLHQVHCTKGVCVQSAVPRVFAYSLQPSSITITMSNTPHTTRLTQSPPTSPTTSPTTTSPITPPSTTRLTQSPPTSPTTTTSPNTTTSPPPSPPPSPTTLPTTLSTYNQEYSSSTAHSITLKDIFSVGSLVIFKSNGLRGYITEINEHAEMCDVRYELDNQMEYDVELASIKLSTVFHSATRSGCNRHATLPPSASTNTNTAAPGTSTIIASYNHLKDAFKKSPSFINQTLSTANGNLQHPLVEYLSTGRKKGKGWLRKIIKKVFIKSYPKNEQMQPIQAGSDLTLREKAMLNMMTSLLSGYSPYSGPAKGYSKLISHAFGIHKNTRLGIYKRSIDHNFSNIRKVRKDSGMSVINCEKMRKRMYTGFNSFKKKRNSEFRETTDKIPHTVLTQEWDALTESQRNAYDQLAQCDLVRARKLWDDLKDLLLKTKGKIPYSTMASHLGNIVSENTIMNVLKSQEGYHIRKDCILPALDAAAKHRRVVWAHTFWWFWKMAKFCPPEQIQYVLVHMDEKWFYSIKTRTNCKVLTSIGLEPNDYYCHHKSYLGKIMYIVVTAYVPIDNDITKGGQAIPVACVRAGRDISAKKDSYKRVYRGDGSYHYPKVPDNLLRRQGESYFQNMDITGSTEGTDAKPKCSLLQVYKDEIIPAIEDKIVSVLNKNGKRKICIVKQEDSAGAHQDQTYRFEMREEFLKRDWLLFNQPSQSPVTNVHDACIFPMMSKEVSKEQAVSFGSTLLRQEELHNTVMKVWNNSNHKQAMARAFAANPQIVCAIIEHEGDNDYLSEKGGLSFGIRSTYRANEEGDGIEMIQLAPQTEAETAAGIILEERKRKGILRYEPPSLNTLDKANPTSEMKEILMQFLSEDLITDKDSDVRDSLTQLLLAEADDNTS